jgi:hypothetical protein
MSLESDRRSRSRTRCIAEARQAMRAAAEHLKADPTVEHVDILAPTQTETGEHALEVTLAEHERLRPAVLRTIASHDLDVDVCEPIAAHTHRRAILRPR